MEALTACKIPIGWLLNATVIWLKYHASELFTFIRAFLSICLGATFDFLMYPPFLVALLLIFSNTLVQNYLWRALVVCSLLFLVFLDYYCLIGMHLFTIAAMIGIMTAALLMQDKWNLSQNHLWCAFITIFLAVIDRFWLGAYIPLSFSLIAIFAILAWFMQKSWSVVILTIAGFLFIINQGYWRDTMETLSVLLWACILCMGIGVPCGIFAAHHPLFRRFLQPFLDLMQTLPAFVYLIPALFFFRIGMVPGLVATFVFVLPIPIRLTETGISSTPKTLLEAAEAFGASSWKLLWKIELPHALPAIRASMTQTIMLSLSMVVITATVGGNGLGVKVYRALQTSNIALGFEAGCVIVVLAIVLDRIFRPGKRC
ncbi:MAG: glycine betaine/proline transport system permease protein [Candidatus Tokpelaia sp. JSC188]|nr:MAG: glycine betaine/proline transport system permease protein [Candidatus Tokpelaia sp. JSC188]